MCRVKSCLVLKDRVFCPDYNSHQQMLEELGIEDDYLHASKTFVRVEFTPPDNTKSLIEPLDRWTLEVNQDIVPEWWDEKADRQRVEEAVEIWRKGHVFTEGKHIVTTGTVYAYGDAEVQVYNDTMVAAYDSTTVKAYNNAKVYAFGKTTVETVSNAPVEAYDDATVKAYGTAKVQASDRAVVKAYSNTTVEAYDSAMVGAHNSVTVKAHDNAKVKAFDRAIVRACNSATVEAFDSAMVVYPEERKIIYPAGWTTKMHE